MEHRLFVAPLARRDLEEILEYIREREPDAAARMLERFAHAFILLSQWPHMGPRVIAPARLRLRKVSIVPYIAFYRIQGDAVQIVRVLHASRDFSDAKLFPKE